MTKRILRPTLFAALIFGATATGLFAQTPGPGPQNPPDGPPPGHHGPPPSPLFRALDTNHDGVISAEEIANAPAALKALADSSGQITRESLRPPHRDEDRRPPSDDSQGPGRDTKIVPTTARPRRRTGRIHPPPVPTARPARRLIPRATPMTAATARRPTTSATNRSPRRLRRRRPQRVLRPERVLRPDRAARVIVRRPICCSTRWTPTTTGSSPPRRLRLPPPR